MTIKVFKEFSFLRNSRNCEMPSSHHSRHKFVSKISAYSNGSEGKTVKRIEIIFGSYVWHFIYYKET